ncbi:MAG TPA: M28 family peptidase, partial [Planctomycetota bacterium]|nr:M28 family peptidase [Planctomycetota bacterium]
PYPSFGISKEDGTVLRRALQEGHAVELDVQLVAHVEERASTSVEAVLPARSGAPAGFFLICAHGDSDSGGPGANDNASGVAIVLEMARAWQQAIARGWVPAPAREVRFVIWASEIRSTRVYLDRMEAERKPLLGVLNFDQAGFGVGAEQMNMEPDDLTSNAGLLAALQTPLRAHAGSYGLPEHWATNKSLGGTDSYVFSGSKRFRRGGLPAVTLFTSAWDRPEDHPRTPGQVGESWQERDLVHVDYDPYYHSAGDLPSLTTDLEGHNMVWCAAAGWLGVQGYLEHLPEDYLPPLSEADLPDAAPPAPRLGGQEKGQTKDE